MVTASIGPRSFDRGKCLGFPDPANHQSLQLGRGRLTAERDPLRDLPSSGERASIGPRSFDRGKLDRDDGALALLARASIGPRSFDRGKNALIDEPPVDLGASIGPRSFDRGKGVGVGMDTKGRGLQLGRGRLTAESALTFASSGSPSLPLQLGRGRLTAESSR